MDKNWCVYLLECKDETYYCWITNDIDKRIKKHNEWKWAKYTRARKPVKLLFATENKYTKSEASKIEYETKQKKKQEKLPFLKNK